MFKTLLVGRGQGVGGWVGGWIWSSFRQFWQSGQPLPLLRGQGCFWGGSWVSQVFGTMLNTMVCCGSCTTRFWVMLYVIYSFFLGGGRDAL